MTYTDLYQPAIQEYLRKWNDYFDAFVFRSCEGYNVTQLQDEVVNLENQLKALTTNKPAPFECDLSQALEQRLATSIAAFERSQADAYEEADTARQQAQQAAQQARTLAEEASKASVQTLTEKYDTLLSYKDAIKDAILRYEIQPSDLVIDEDKMSREDMEKMVDTALKACKSVGGDPVRRNLRVLYEFDEDGDDADTRLYRAFAILFMLVVAGPIILLGLFGYSVYKLVGVYPNKAGLQFADKLLYGVDCSKFRDPVVGAEDALDTSEIDAALEEKLAKLEAISPLHVKENLQSEINQNHEKIAKEYRDATNTIMARYDQMIELWETHLKSVKDAVEEYVSKLTPCGTVASNTPVLDTNWVLGKSKGIIDIKYDVGLRNMVFANKSPEMLKFIRLLLSNILLSVVPKNLAVTVYDPESLGADFATFMAQETNEYVTVETKDYKKVFDACRDYAQATLRQLDQMNVNEFNQQAFEKGMVTRDYKLLIIYSGVDKPEEDKLLVEFMNISARAGVFIWIVHPRNIGTNSTFYVQPFEGVEEPYPTSPELFNTVMATYTNAYINRRDAGINYKEAFADKYMPPENWWKENTDKCIKLNIGLQDGDPSKGYALELGDANVHCLCVGASGAGKSAFLNAMLITAMSRYAPSTLEIIMLDFKIVEFRTYSNVETHYSAIPHPKILAGTKDGEYAVSIFDYLIAEMGRREKLFAPIGAKKLETYNKHMREMGTPEKCLPRILVVIDEFQVMFTEVDQKCVEIIQSRIRSLSKLARAFGCHLFFCSQSMAGTMPKDIKDQFSLRICLRASSDVSGEIIGSPIASKIKSKFGYCYSNTNAGEIQDSTRLWRIPFLSEKAQFEYIDQIMEKCHAEGELDRHAYFYDEEQTFSDSLLPVHIQTIRDSGFDETRLFVLGERTAYSLNKAVCNICLQRRDGENIIFYAFEAADFNNLCMTLIGNIQAQPGAQLLVNCADPDLFSILDFESWYSEQFLDIARPMLNVGPWLEQITSMIEARKQMSPDEYTPLYFLCLRWDKQMGISRDENYKQTDMFKSILMNGPAVDIHIIYGAQLYKEVPNNIMGMFNHIICAKGPEDASYKYLNSTRAQKLPTSLGFAVYHYGSLEFKFKIYQHKFTKKAATREVFL